jgi:hypothetical protein
MIKGALWLWLTTALVLAPAALWADDTPDPCPEAACEVNCGDANGSTTCVVQLGLNKFGHKARATIKGEDVPLLCVQSGTRVKWVPANATSFYAVTFNPKHTPFSQSLFLGDAKHPFFDTATNHGGTDRCYVYSFVVCNKHGVCQHLDPKVIIRGSP